VRYKYAIPVLCILGTMSLHAEEKGLGDTLQRVGHKKIFTKTLPKKKENKTQTRFIFHDEYDANAIGLKDKSAAKDKSESYNYDNKSRFKFKFNDGSEQSNLVDRYETGSMTGSMDGGHGGGGGRR